MGIGVPAMVTIIIFHDSCDVGDNDTGDSDIGSIFIDDNDTDGDLMVVSCDVDD